ncbi:RNA polymerase sigma factor [Granulicella sp. S190]|uniref:RNA polymerase sigma factor n=1 Tax=Granulicella sp. S190 TaxID=1747226 RepID=UPI00131EA34B|nr:sigma-70 family RNA polymerase sigma factor [Granulicella sp. S190]
MDDRFLGGYAATTSGRRTESDDILVVAAAAGDAYAYEELCRRHSKQIFRTVFRIVRNPEDAEDLVQESLMKAFKHLATFKQTSAFSTWLTRIGINCALMQLRSRRKGLEGHLIVHKDFEDGLFEDFAADLPSPEDLVVEAERSGALSRAITSLPARLRDVMTVRCYDDASTKEIAILMGLTEPAVKARLHRARARLRRTMLSRMRPRRSLA